MGTSRTVWVLGIVASLAQVPLASAKTIVLAIGGGPTSSNSQISLERNIVFFRETLPRVGLADATSKYLFAAGQERRPDVCFDESPPPANLMLARLVGPESGISRRFRPHDLEHIEAPATRQAILAQFGALNAPTSPGKSSGTC